MLPGQAQQSELVLVQTDRVTHEVWQRQPQMPRPIKRAINPGEEGSFTVTPDSPSCRSGHVKVRMAQIPKLTVRFSVRTMVVSNLLGRFCK